jgi:hypothetical protein
VGPHAYNPFRLGRAPNSTSVRNDWLLSAMHPSPIDGPPRRVVPSANSTVMAHLNGRIPDTARYRSTADTPARRAWRSLTTTVTAIAALGSSVVACSDGSGPKVGAPQPAALRVVRGLLSDTVFSFAAAPVEVEVRGSDGYPGHEWSSYSARCSAPILRSASPYTSKTAGGPAFSRPLRSRTRPTQRVVPRCA